MIRANTKIRVRYKETDAMGIVHHSNYFVWYEVARIELMDSIGLPYKELEAQGALLPLTKVQTRYRKPAFFDDILTIKAFIKESPFVRIEVHYEVWRGEELLADGVTEHVFMTRQGHPMRPPKAFTDVIEKGLKESR